MVQRKRPINPNAVMVRYMDEIKQHCKAGKEGPHRPNLKLSRRVWKLCM